MTRTEATLGILTMVCIVIPVTLVACVVHVARKIVRRPAKPPPTTGAKP
jgi:hypothetical protein